MVVQEEEEQEVVVVFTREHRGAVRDPSFSLIRHRRAIKRNSLSLRQQWKHSRITAACKAASFFDL